MASISDILAWRNISASVQKVETGIPDRVPPEFNKLTEEVLGDRTTYVTFYGQRQAARRVEYGAQSRAKTLRPLGEQSVTLLHFAEHIKIRQELLLRLRQPDDLLAQKMAQVEIARAGADFRVLFDNTRVVMQVSMLGNGKLWFDSGGNPLGTSSGAALTIDYSVPAGNQNQCAGLIGATWSAASTNIIQHVENVRIQMKKNTGRDLANAFYGSNIAAYLFNNTAAKTYWQFNQALYGQFQSNPGVIPNGTFGIKNWHRMGDSFFASNNDVGSSETLVNLWNPDQVTFAPAIDRNVYTLYEGSIAVPTRLGVEDSAESALGGVKLVYGMGGYAVLEADPVGVKQIGFDTVMPMWKTPLDLFQAIVAF